MAENLIVMYRHVRTGTLARPDNARVRENSPNWDGPYFCRYVPAEGFKSGYFEIVHEGKSAAVSSEDLGAVDENSDPSSASDTQFTV